MALKNVEIQRLISALETESAKVKEFKTVIIKLTAEHENSLRQQIENETIDKEEYGEKVPQHIKLEEIKLEEGKIVKREELLFGDVKTGKKTIMSSWTNTSPTRMPRPEKITM